MQMAQLYDDPQCTTTAESTLHALRQGHQPVEDYVAEFCLWATDTGWNDAALQDQFRLGLSEDLMNELAHVGVPSSLENLVNLAIQLDRRFRERRAEKAGISIPPTNRQARPVQLGLLRSPLSSEEKLRRQENLCLYCGVAGHYLQNCPVRPIRTRTIPSTYLANCSFGSRAAHITSDSRERHPSVSHSRLRSLQLLHRQGLCSM